MDNLISIEEALNIPNPQFVDLRSPEEYALAHIPGAINLPLLENEERALVGLIYKRQSPEAAIDKGFELIAPKLPEFHRAIKDAACKREVILYCWRGGMRSQSLSQVLHVLDTKHCRLKGGYKSFRRYVLDYFEKPFKKELIVLDGLTGVGKTEILQELRKMGLPAIDLEDLANNRGSVFGNVGLSGQPTQKHFEGLLFWECFKYRHFPKLVVECESQRIGNVMIPASFFAAMGKAYRVLVYDDFNNRVRRLVATYTERGHANSEEQLKNAINNLRKRIGNKKTDHLLLLLTKKDYREIVRILLKDYYDPLYHYPAQPSEKYGHNLPGYDLESTVAALKEMIEK